MPAKKSKSVKLSQAEKDDLSKLKKRGIYNPKNPRKKPTKYAKSLLKKFSDFLSGNAGVVKVDRETAKRYRNKDARSGEVRSVGNKVIVTKLPGEKLTFSKKRKEIDITRRMKTGERYVRTPFAKRPTSFEEMQNALGPKDRIAVAFYRGVKKPVEWQYFDQTEFYNTFLGGGSGQSGSPQQMKAFDWALKHSMISHYIEAGKKTARK